MKRNRFVRLLLRSYPAAWRAEYGEELAAMLTEGELTRRAMANVVLSGLRQRFRYSAVWVMGGVAMAIWPSIGVFAYRHSWLSSPNCARLSEAVLVFDIVIGFISASLHSRRLTSAALASAKASLISMIPLLVGVARLILWTPPTVDGKDMSERMMLAFLIFIPVRVISAFLLGLTGATIAKGVSATRRFIGSLN
jgi:hypothetical protein